jgi:hypothetical protein
MSGFSVPPVVWYYCLVLNGRNYSKQRRTRKKAKADEAERQRGTRRCLPFINLPAHVPMQ